MRTDLHHLQKEEQRQARMKVRQLLGEWAYKCFNQRLGVLSTTNVIEYFKDGSNSDNEEGIDCQINEFVSCYWQTLMPAAAAADTAAATAAAAIAIAAAVGGGVVCVWRVCGVRRVCGVEP